MEELKTPAFVKLVCPVRMCWADKAQTLKTKSKRNAGTTKNNNLEVED